MTVPSWARVGAKVVCIDDAPHFGTGGHKHLGPLPSIGAIYVIDGFPDNEFLGRIGHTPRIIINGLPNLSAKSQTDWGWGIRRFRPVHTLRGDVRAIKSMLRELPAESRLDRLLEVLDQ